MRSATVSPEGGSGARLGVFVVSYPAYWFMFVVVAVALTRGGGTTQGWRRPSWFVVVVVSVANPIAEEFLLRGFIANVLRSDGFHVALAAAVLARVIPHVYQGPVGLVGAIAFGVALARTTCDPGDSGLLSWRTVWLIS
jgi:membrane protease YdiL (CAAX protease family)